MATKSIGSLAVLLGLDTKKFEASLKKTEKDIGRLSKRFKSVGRDLSTYVSAPIVAFGALTVKTSGDFEAAMNRVSAVTQTTGKDFDALRNRAKKLGSTTQYSASEAASGIETLAKNGLKATQILSGTIEATLSLAAATGTNLANSADIATDVMANFKKKGKDMQKVVDGITGTTLNSKFSIDAYRLALAQAGGVAGSVGVSLEDFNTAIAAISPLFSSGSDAGTSFKTFLQRLVPRSKEAADIMKQLGLSFFDSNGQMKDLADISGQLQKAFSGLSEEQRINAATTIFGTDAMRTAFGLADVGSKSFNNLAANINKVSATQQAEARMKGFNGALKKLASAFEGLQIAIGDSGLLDFATKFIEKLVAIVSKLSQLNPSILKTATIIAGLAAAIGPLTVVMGTLLALIPPMIAGWRTLATVQLASARAFAIATIKITAIIAAITGLVLVAKAIEESWSKFLIFFARLWSQIAIVVANGALNVIESVESISSIVGVEFGAAKDSIKEFRDEAQKNLDVLPLITFADVAGEVGEKIKNTFFQLKDSVVGSVTGINESLGSLGGAPSGVGSSGGGTGGGKGSALSVKGKGPTELKSGGLSGIGFNNITSKAQEMQKVFHSVSSDIAERLALIENRAFLFGEKVGEVASEKIGVLKESITQLLASGFSPMSDEIAGLMEQIKELKKESLAEYFTEIKDSIVDSLGSAFEAIVSGTVTAKEAISGLVAQLVKMGIAAAIAATIGSAPGPIGLALASAAGVAASVLFKKAVPEFANGGNFSGGLRLVGERGPELEATGASRIISNNKLKGMLGGGQHITVTVRGEVSGDKLKYVMDQYSVNSGYRS